jgi:siderophore synthetase component
MRRAAASRASPHRRRFPEFTFQSRESVRFRINETFDLYVGTIYVRTEHRADEDSAALERPILCLDIARQLEPRKASRAQRVEHAHRADGEHCAEARG